jgi:hypothetical protein
LGPQFVTGQSAANSVPGTSCAVTINGVTAGNMLVAVGVNNTNTATTTTAVTDNKGNTWTRIASEPGINNGGAAPSGSVGVYMALNVAAGNTQVTFTDPAAFLALSVAEYNPNGLSTTDGTNQNHSGTGTTVNPGNITTANADDVLIVGAGDSPDSVTWAAGASYALRACINSNTNNTVGYQDRSVAATSNYATAFGVATTSCWAAAAVAIKSAGAAFKWQQLTDSFAGSVAPSQPNQMIGL